MKKRIAKLENQKSASKRGIVIINSEEWEAVYGDEAQPGDKFISEWEEELEGKLIIIDDISKARRALLLDDENNGRE